MKTKKVKILSSILALAILVCSLSVVSGFVTTAETNSEELAVNNLKTAWQFLSINSSIANSPLTLPYMQNQMNTSNIIGTDDWCAKTFTFNENGTFNKTPASTETYVRGLLFNVNDGELFTSNSSTFSNAFNNNDSLYFTFNPGTVNASGNLLVVLQYNGYGAEYVRYAEVPVNVGDTGDKKIEIEKLTYKCGDSSKDATVYTFTQLSDVLGQYNSKPLFTIKIMFDKTVNIEGATISALQGAKYVALPEGNENFTALQWYNAAKDLDVRGYENAAAFTTALNNLKNYLTQNDPDFVVSELKTAWQSLSMNSSIADFNTENFVMNQRDGNNNASSDTFGSTFTFNEDGSFDKAPTSLTTYHRGLIFNVKAGERFTSASSAFSNAFNNNDSLYFTFNPGTVKASGNLLVILQYNADGSKYELYAEVPVVEGDNEIHIEKLTYKCADATNYPDNYTFTKLSDMLNQFNGKDILTIKIMFDKTVDIEGATISALQGAKYATLPAETEGFTSALEWYNAAKDLDVSGYENAVAFTTALDNLKTYLSENDPNFVVSELKESWGKLSKDVSIAKLNTKVLVNQLSADTSKTPATIGIAFNDDNTFNKTVYDGGQAVGGSYYIYGLVFSKNDSTGNNKNFDSNINSTDNNSFNNAFSDDSLYFTFNPGTVTAAGRMWVILQYNGYGSRNVLYGTVEIAANDSNTNKKIVIKDLDFKCGYADATDGDPNTYKFNTLSKALKYTNSKGEEKDLFTVKVMFNPTLVTTGASISGLKTVKSETIPSDDNLELISGKSLRVDTDFYGEIANDFAVNRDRLYNNLISGKIVGNVNQTDDVDICDLVALVKLGYEDDETYKLIADMNKDGYITEADKMVLISVILNR